MTLFFKLQKYSRKVREREQISHKGQEQQSSRNKCFLCTSVCLLEIPYQQSSIKQVPKLCKHWANKNTATQELAPWSLRALRQWRGECFPSWTIQRELKRGAPIPTAGLKPNDPTGRCSGAFQRTCPSSSAVLFPLPGRRSVHTYLDIYKYRAHVAETVQHIQNRGIQLFFSCSYGLDLNVISTCWSAWILTPAACSILYASSSAQSVNVRLCTVKYSDFSFTLPQADPLINIWRFRKVIFLKEVFFYDVNKQKNSFSFMFSFRKVNIIQPRT